MKKLILFIIFLILWVSLFYALEVCPNAMQAVLVVKIIPFVKNFESLTAGGSINIGVYNAPEFYRCLETATKKINFKTHLIPLSSVDTGLENLHIIYISRGSSASVIEKLNSFAKKNKILTVSDDPQAALDFNLTLSFHVINEKPKIMVNMKSAREEGIAFSSRVLSLADVRNMEKNSQDQ